MNRIRRWTAIAATAAVLLVAHPGQADARGGNRDYIHSLVVQYFPASQVNKAMRVARCESSYNPKAINRNRNGTHDLGVFQLNTGGTMQSLGVSYQGALNAETNVKAAARLWRSRGWRPWVCARKV